MKKKKRWIVGLLAIGLLCKSPEPIQAETKWPEGISISSGSACVIEVNTGTVLYEKNATDKSYPASITKVLTVDVALENAQLDETVVFSEEAVFGGNEGDTSNIARDYLEEMTLEETIYAVMLESANECAYATAEHVGADMGGDYQTFIDAMNEKAKSLGCVNSNFMNPNGLHNPDHYTCAYDMALIACDAYQKEDFRIICGSKRYTIPPTNKHSDPTYLNNNHAMIHNYKTDAYLYDYCTGGKTGFTNEAGNTLVTFAEKDGLTLCCVVMQSSRPAHYIDTRALFDYCFENFQAVNISENETSITETEAKDMGIFNTNGFFVTLDTNAYVVLPKDVSFSQTSYEIVRDGLPEGTIASLRYTYADKEIGSVDIVASDIQVEDSYFEQAKQKEEASDVKVVKIKPGTIFLIVFGIILFVALVYFGKQLYEKFYVIKHNFNVWKHRKSRFRSKTKKKPYRRRDRLFK